MSTCIQSLACECHSVAPGYERVSAVGEIDIATGSRLTDVLRGAQARAQSVVLDLSAATFIDASGVRVLLAADTRARAQAGSFVIARPTSPVERVLQLVGADRVLAILRPGILSPEPATPIRSTPTPATAGNGMAVTRRESAPSRSG